MDMKSKMLMVVVFLAVFVSLSFTFYQTIVLQDFEVIAEE